MGTLPEYGEAAAGRQGGTGPVLTGDGHDLGRLAAPLRSTAVEGLSGSGGPS